MYNFFNIEYPKAMECLTIGKCMLDPRALALNETFVYETRQLTYYILKIKELGYENLAIVNTIIKTLASINFGFEYQQKDIEKVLSKLHEKRKEVIVFYENICRQRNLDCQLLNSFQPSNEDLNIIKAIMAGEKQSIKRNTQISSYKKNLYEIMLMIAKSTSATLTKLDDYEIECVADKYKTLEFLNSLNFLNIREEKLTKKILDFSQTSHELNKKLEHAYSEKYSQPTTHTVSFNELKGKCILVSGENFNDLDLLLQATEGTGINIYTHDLMLLSQQYPYFRRYPHLVGQYQHKGNNIQLDFSTFPGPIMLTRDYSNKIDAVYRGNLFSTDIISGKGITRIIKHDFSKLIKCANETNGFIQSKKKISIKIGVEKNKIDTHIDEMCNQFKENKFKKLYIVGLLNYGYHSDEFFENMYKKIGDENYIVSLAYEKKANNIFHIKSYYDFSLIYKILEKIQTSLDTQQHPIKVILTQCTNTSLSNLFILKKLGIEDIYITCCNVNTLNPSILNCIKSHFNVKQISEENIENIEL